jgi:prevent-host-death family protein
MRIVGAREANQQFSRLLREAEDGHDILITRRGEPVARLTSAKKLHDAKTRAAALKQMEKLMDKGIDLGGRRFTRDEMHED